MCVTAQFALGQFEVRFDHHFSQLLELHFRRPTELAFRLRRVADQQIDFRRTKESLIDFDVFDKLLGKPAERRVAL